MNRIFWIAGILIFISVTALVVSIDTSQTRRIHFSNQDLAITNKGNDKIDNTGTNINFNNTNISNTNISATDTRLNIQDSGYMESKSVNINDNSSYSNQDTEFDDYDYEYSTQNTDFKNENQIEYKNLNTEHLDTIISDAKNISTEPVDMSNKPFRQMNRDRYQYKNIFQALYFKNILFKK